MNNAREIVINYLIASEYREESVKDKQEGRKKRPGEASSDGKAIIKLSNF